MGDTAPDLDAIMRRLIDGRSFAHQERAALCAGDDPATMPHPGKHQCPNCGAKVGVGCTDVPELYRAVVHLQTRDKAITEAANALLDARLDEKMGMRVAALRKALELR